MANHQNSSIRVYATLIPALKAPPHGSPGQRPGFLNRSVRPARAQESLRPFRAEEIPRIRSRGVAPGWHAPRRWRVIVAEFSSGETCYEAIYEITAGFGIHLRVARAPTMPEVANHWVR